MNAKKKFDRLIRELRAWCADPRRDQREQTAKEIRKILAGKHPRASGAASAAAGLFWMGAWYAHHGALAVLEGRPEGWADLERTLLYSSLRARISPSAAFVPGAAANLAHAVLFDENEVAEHLAVLLVSSLDGGGFMGWGTSRFGALMLKIWGIMKGTEIDIGRPGVDTGAYQGILDAWHKEDALPQALAAACDYHLEQTSEHGDSEFAEVPYVWFPVDILIVRAVREKLGLSTPPVSHPLLATPLASIPPSSQRPRMQPDPLLDEVTARAKADGLL